MKRIPRGVRPPVRGRMLARWIGALPALLLLFVAASAVFNPKTTLAISDANPIVSSQGIGNGEEGTAVGEQPTATVEPQLPLSPPASLAPVAGSLMGTSVPPIIPTATIAVPTATAPAPPTATPIPPAATPIPPAAIPSGLTATPNMGAAGNAMPVDGVIRVPVLMYHYIRVNPNPKDSLGYGLSVTPTDFAVQINWLVANGYHAVFPSDLAAAMTRNAPLPTKPIVLTFDDGYRDFYDQAWPVLKTAGMKSASAVITTGADKADRGDQAYMSWWMIRELDASGMVEIASHTLTHGDLTKMSPAQRWAELTKSKDALEQQLGHAIRTFVYPSGRYDGATMADAKRAGYQIAFTTQSGKVRVPQDNGTMLQLVRVRVAGGTSLNGFARNLA